MEWSAWRIMWVLVFFDLPVDTDAAKREYVRFRKVLLEDGFQMMQFSVYLRPCPSEQNAQVHDRRVLQNLPPEGEVRLLHLTDAQFSRMKVFLGKKRAEPEKGFEQLTLF